MALGCRGDVGSRLERVDRPFYEERLRAFLPERMLDFHTHIYRAAFTGVRKANARTWPEHFTPVSWGVPALKRYYERLFPGKQVEPVCFGMPTAAADVDASNAFVAESARAYGVRAFLLSSPRWSARELEERLDAGPFLGLKPYPVLAGSSECSIFAFLPPAHLRVAEERGLCVLLHLPRAGRLADPANIAELHEVSQKYPRLKLVIAHIGRAYCLPNAERGLPLLRDCPQLMFDFSASANPDVFALALQEVGPQRLIFGTDLPAVAFRAKRICEGDHYINIVARSRTDDPHIRVADPCEAGRLTFFVYEQVEAFRQAALAAGLSAADVEDVFRGNALRLLYG